MKSNKRLEFQGNFFRYLILFGLLGGLFIHSFIKYGLFNQTIGFIIPKAVATVATTNGFMPDWSQMKFSDMIISEGGQISYILNGVTETRVWSAGQSIAEFLTLGDFSETELGLENLNLSQIANATGLNLSSLKLSSFSLTKWQTLPDLVSAIPGLGKKSVSSVKPINDFLQKYGISGGTIANASKISSIADVEIGKVINLKNYSLFSIPNIQNAVINKFNNWQNSTINGVPGLSNMTWDNLVGLQSLDLSSVGKVDLVLRDVEANRTRSISGSYQQGFNVPCNQSNCAHAELAGVGDTTGVQWISGKIQKVKGGFGILKVLNGGKEPTGRNPFGSAFKQVVWDVDEPTASVQTAMFFRICRRIPFIGRTCSPYFIGPVPFIKYVEKDPIILGQPNSLPD